MKAWGYIEVFIGHYIKEMFIIIIININLDIILVNIDAIIVNIDVILINIDAILVN